MTEAATEDIVVAEADTAAAVVADTTAAEVADIAAAGHPLPITAEVVAAATGAITDQDQDLILHVSHKSVLTNFYFLPRSQRITLSS